MSISSNITGILRELPPHVHLVAVSKFHPATSILEAYNAGQRIFGESKAQELTAKYEVLPKDIQWHFIGHLQTNKIKYIVPFVDLIHSVDSERLLEEIDRQAQRVQRVIRVLLQIHIASEETKFGFSYDECRDYFSSGAWKRCKNICICGLMGMATFTGNEQQILSEYEGLASFFRETQETYFQGDNNFRELSMGMSEDYRIAIDSGSTLIRIGSSIFGNRNY